MAYWWSGMFKTWVRINVSTTKMYQSIKITCVFLVIRHTQNNMFMHKMSGKTIERIIKAYHKPKRKIRFTHYVHYGCNNQLNLRLYEHTPFVMIWKGFARLKLPKSTLKLDYNRFLMCWLVQVNYLTGLITKTKEENRFNVACRLFAG